MLSSTRRLCDFPGTLEAHVTQWSLHASSYLPLLNNPINNFGAFFFKAAFLLPSPLHQMVVDFTWIRRKKHKSTHIVTTTMTNTVTITITRKTVTPTVTTTSTTITATTASLTITVQQSCTSKCFNLSWIHMSRVQIWNSSRQYSPLKQFALPSPNQPSPAPAAAAHFPSWFQSNCFSGTLSLEQKPW